MKKIISVSVFALLALLVSLPSIAQVGPDGYNPNSVRPVLEDDVMFRTTVWRKINLLEKQNTPFFSRDNEITRVIIDGLKREDPIYTEFGNEIPTIQPYEYSADPRSTGFETPIEKEECLKKMASYEDPTYGEIPIKPEQLYLLELKESLIFDRRRSRMYWDIQSVSVIVPAGTNPNENFDITVATFKYKDLYEFFKALYQKSQEKGTFEDLRAFWYNPENPKRHLSLADAFDLRLFSSRITKVANPNDDEIADIVISEYGANNPETAKKVLYESQRVEYDLMEFEHNLWEF